MFLKLIKSPISYVVMAMIIAIMAFVGRLLDIPFLYQIKEGLPETSVNTIVLILLMSVALLIGSGNLDRVSRFWSMLFITGIVFSLSLTNLTEVYTEHFFGMATSSDLAKLQLAAIVASPQTSWLFFLLSFGVLSGLLFNEKYAYNLEQGAATLAAFLLLIYTSAYLNHITDFYQSVHSLGISIVTIAAVACLTCATLILHGDRGFWVLILQKRLGSFLLRRALMFVLAAVVVLSAIRSYLASNEVIYADGIVISLMLMMSLVFLYTYSVKINAIEEQKECIEGYFEEVFRAAPNGMVLVNSQGKIIMANDHMTKVSLYSHDELKNMHVEGLVPEPLRKEHQILREAYIKRPRRRPMGVGRNLTLLKKDGSICPVEISISPAQVNNEKIIVAAVIDISYRLEMEENLETLERKAYIDTLTQINNREWFDESVGFFLEGARRLNKKVAFCFCDLDGFKQINDRYGHGIGDEVLIEVSRRMQMVIRKDDAVIRFGGDEFLIILNHIDHQEAVERVMNALIDAMNKPIVIGSLAINCGASIGVSFFPDDGQTAEVLVEKADRSLYHVKSSGKNSFSFTADTLDSE